MVDSAREFDLLGESVPQVRVSARTLALLGLFIVQSILTMVFLVFLWMEQEGRSRCHSFWLGFGPGPSSSVGRAPAASARVPGSIPGWDVLSFFPSC